MYYIELHAHLGASTPADVLWDIAMEQGIKTGAKSYEEFIKGMLTPNHMVHEAYLNKFHVTQSIQSSLHGIERSVYHAVANAYKHRKLNQIELRFNPALRNQDKRYDIDAIIYHATFGMKKAMLAYPIKAGIIIETDRTFKPQMAEMLAAKAVQFKHEGVVGFDMSGFTPKGFQLKKFAKAFQIAKAGGLMTTVHAGEVMPAQEVIDAIQHLYVDRIGHGIKVVSSKRGMRIAAEHNVHFEVCPTSNVVTGCAKSYNDMVSIIGIMIENELSWNLNTDGSEFLGVTVKNEYEKLVEAGLPEQWIKKSQDMARRASFIK